MFLSHVNTPSKKVRASAQEQVSDLVESDMDTTTQVLMAMGKKMISGRRKRLGRRLLQL